MGTFIAKAGPTKESKTCSDMSEPMVIVSREPKIVRTTGAEACMRVDAAARAKTQGRTTRKTLVGTPICLLPERWEEYML